jgi:hypothetical protein
LYCADASQPLAIVKSAEFGPVSLTLVMLSEEPLAPELVRVTYCSVVVELIALETNSSEVADGVRADEAVGGGSPVPPVPLVPPASPVPASWMFCVEPGASSAIVIEALRAPAATGMKTTVREHEAPGAYAAVVQADGRADWPELFVMAKSAAFCPPMTMEEIWRFALPEFVTMTD